MKSTTSVDAFMNRYIENDINNSRLAWCLSTGLVTFNRDFHDSLREDLQGKAYYAKTIREFENVCALLRSGITS